MKKLFLVALTAMLVFSCSTDNTETAEFENVDLTVMVPSKALSESGEGMYYGIFGHNELKYLHGKVLINAANNGKYSASIELENGDQIKFEGKKLNENNINYTSKRGSFDLNIADYANPIATNVFIDKESESYIVAKKSTTRGGGPIVLGIYIDNVDSNFFGNWDMIGDGSVSSFGFGFDLSTVIVSHVGLVNPRIDSTMESEDYCIGVGFPFVLVIDATITDVWADNQTSMLGGFPASWSVKSIVGFHGDDVNPYSPVGTCTPAAFGTWSWNGRTGVMFITSTPAPVRGFESTVTNSSPYNR